MSLFNNRLLPLPDWLVNGAEEVKLEARRNALVECDALLDAGWKFELPEIVNHNPPKQDWSKSESEPWQWYWRSPPRRRGSKGRRYLSTSQAYRALLKQQAVTAKRAVC